MVVSTAVLLGFAALAVDVGQLFSVEAELQRAADSSALAGASGYFTNAGLIRDHLTLTGTINSRSQEYALYNETYRAGGTEVEISDITFGTYDFNNPNAPLDQSGVNRFNAVQVTTRRTGSSTNGAVGFFFAKIFGMAKGDVTATAIAAMDDRVAGYDYGHGNGGLLPFTIHIEIYNDMLGNGPDEWSFDGGVSNAGDDVPEIKLFPYKLSGEGNNNVGAGNFGILEFGGGGASQVAENIEEGVDPEDMEEEMGTSQPMYVDANGNPQTYWVSGEPGMKSSLADEVEARIGDVIGFFLHDQVTASGDNTDYHNVGIRFGRIMHIDLNGSPNTKRLVIQPVAYTGEGVIVKPGAPSTNGQMGRLMLVK